MRKFLLFLVALLLIGGAGFVGYTVFNSKNIEKIEIEGEMQTLYLLNETLTPDFEDAKLKIIYKDGSVKYQSMKDAFKNSDDSDKKITHFDTSIIRSTVMKLTYKSHIVEVNYSVISGGMYYLSGDEKVTYVNNKPQVSSSNTYAINTTKQFIYLEENGNIRYYNYSTAKSRWLLYDGNYLSGYNYTISGNKINVYLGGEEPSYQIQADAPNGVMQTYSVKVNKDSTTGLDTGKETYKFTNFAVNTNIEATNVNLICSYVTDPGTTIKYLQFERRDTLETTSNEIYLSVSYSNYLIDTQIGATKIRLFKDVYVVVGSGMIKNDSLVTSEKIMQGFGYAELAYESVIVSFNYKVT